MNTYTNKVAGAVLSFALIMPIFASAQTTSDVTSQIQALMNQINSLQQQLRTLVQSNTGSTTLPIGTTTSPRMGDGDHGGCPQFDRDLAIGSQGSDVSDLQETLADEGYLSPTSTRGFFGKMTMRALREFQKHLGLSSSGGSFGSLTRNFFRNRCGGGNAGTSTPPSIGHGGQGGWMGSSTPCMSKQDRPDSDTSVSGDAHTNVVSMHPCRGGTMPRMMMPWHKGGSDGESGGNATPPRPCPKNENTDEANSENNAAAVALALFVPHTILPMHPCAVPVPNNTSGGGMHQ